MTTFIESEHPRAIDGTFATKPVVEAAEGLDALSGPDDAARLAYD